MVTRHLVVVGPMAVGKTTLGEALAGWSGRPLRDSDADLVAARGITGRALAETEGVEALHLWEADHLRLSLADPTPSVIAAAASVVDAAACRAALAEPFVIALTAPDDVRAARAAGSEFRREAKEPLPDRTTAYREVADVEIDTAGREAAEVAACARDAIPPEVLAPARVSHVGVCVSDPDRALRFWRDGLGFVPTHSFEVGAEFGRLMELDGVALRSQFLRRDGVTVELLHFTTPPAGGDGARRPVNRLGFTHLSVRVADVDAAAARVTQAGGTVLHDTRTTLGEGAGLMDFVYCIDPDGTRVELMRLPGTE
jgi:shikimate kinase/catechol 2,3-dioxygenase-like lactoylglutathione lyase family enzyme